jgi:hypothetical protein
MMVCVLEVTVRRILVAVVCLLGVVVVSCKKDVSSAQAEAQGSTSAQAQKTGQVQNPTQVSWVTVRDPREQAFSVQVPQGWKTYGGMFRYGPVDVRAEVDTTSADGTINLRVGDATVPPYVVPGPFVQTAAAAKGAYASGQVFATKYGQARFAAMCSGLKVTKSDAMTPKYHPAGSGLIHTTAGEAFFSCTKNGAAMVAYVYSETTLTGPGTPGSNWTVASLGSLMAPAADGTAAGALLQHMGVSLAVNPQWAQMQQAITNRVIQGLNASTNATIQATQQENAREQGIIQQSDTLQENFNDVINGVACTQDASTGQTYEVPLGTGGTQWVNGSNAVVESGMSPGAGFDQLQTISR